MASTAEEWYVPGAHVDVLQIVLPVWSVYITLFPLAQLSKQHGLHEISSGEFWYFPLSHCWQVGALFVDPNNAGAVA